MAIELQGSLEGVVDEMLEGSVAGNIKLIGGSPTINELNVSINGTYKAPEGVDGYNPVKVNVPDAVLDSININTNGIYTPPAGVDGYNEIDVDVKAITQSLNVSSNGTYNVPSGVDGYNPVVVNVPVPNLTTLEVSENGTYTPPSNAAYNNVVVNVQSEIPIITSNNGTIKIVISNGHLLFRFDGFYQANQDWNFSSAFDNPLIAEFLNKFPTSSMDGYAYDSNGVRIGYIGFYNGGIRSWNADDSLAEAGLTWYSIYDFTNSSREQNNEYTPW